MKKYLLLIVLMCCSTLAFAQQRRAFYVYTADGLADIFYTSQVRKFTFAPIDESHPHVYNQIISVYRGGTKMPVTEIDSVSFLTPPLSAFQQEGKLNHISSEAFRQLVIDYKAEPDQQTLKSERPVIIDCWGKWCTYCLQMMPTMEQLAQEYKGRVDFYKVDVDEEPELSAYLASASLPCLYFFPKTGTPVAREGLMDIASIRNIIEKVLLVTDEENPDAPKPEVELNLWKGDSEHAWTDRRFTAQIKCPTVDATLVKYACFLKDEIENGEQTEKELIQRYGDVLPAELLPRVNSTHGLPLTFKVQKNSTYRFLCLVKNTQGGVTVQSADITTDASYTPLMDFQVVNGALAEFIQPQKNHMSVYIKTKEAVEAAFGYLLKREYDEAMARGETVESLLKVQDDRVFTLSAEALAQANNRGYVQVIAPLEEMTDYVCFARMCNAAGKVMTESKVLRTPYAGYNEVIAYPQLNVTTNLIGKAVSCSVNCVSGDAVYASLLILPAHDVTQLLAQGETLESIIETHPAVSVMSEQQVEWLNGQGVSNVFTDVRPSTRYTCIADVYGRLGGRVVIRSDIETLAEDMMSEAIDVVLSGNYAQKMLTASVQCCTANASTATLALIESSKLEQWLATGASLEDLMATQHQDFLKYETFTPEQLTWYNQNGFVTAYGSPQPSTRYTWLLDTRTTEGVRKLVRREVLTPNRYEMELLPYAQTSLSLQPQAACLPLLEVKCLH